MENAKPSRPRAGRIARIAIALVLLALACAAIWVIDRGAHNNMRAGATAASQP